MQEFDQYQKVSSKFDFYTKTPPQKPYMVKFETGLIEKVLGLAGESGETVDKFKKIIRDSNGEINEEQKVEIVKELGDILWYLAQIASYLDVPLSEVATKNIDKLQNRMDRNKLRGSGDNR